MKIDDGFYNFIHMLLVYFWCLNILL